MNKLNGCLLAASRGQKGGERSRYRGAAATEILPPSLLRGVLLRCVATEKLMRFNLVVRDGG